MGAAPGLSPTMAVALLIPFTFRMLPEQGLIMLGAVYTATVAGGAISGILLKIPGAPANIATVMDGYPMAKQGRSKEALHYCFISSFIGGVLGIFVLIFFTPILADFALKFGPSHMFSGIASGSVHGWLWFAFFTLFFSIRDFWYIPNYFIPMGYTSLYCFYNYSF